MGQTLLPFYLHYKIEEMKITFEDVVEFVIKNSDNRERMDKLNKITFPFTTSYDKKYGRTKETLWLWGKYEPSYEDLKEIVEAPLWTFSWDDLLMKKQ